MTNQRKNRGTAVEEAIEKIVALVEDSAQSLPPQQRGAILQKIRQLADDTVAESRAEATKQQHTKLAAVSGGASGGRKKAKSRPGKPR